MFELFTFPKAAETEEGSEWKLAPLGSLPADDVADARAIPAFKLVGVWQPVASFCQSCIVTNLNVYRLSGVSRTERL